MTKYFKYLLAVAVIATILPARAEDAASGRLVTDAGVPVQGYPLVIEDGDAQTVAITDAQGLFFLPDGISANAEIVVPLGNEANPVLRQDLGTVLQGGDIVLNPSVGR